MDFPGGSPGIESTCNVGDLGLIPGLGRSPGEGGGYPLQYSGLENSLSLPTPFLILLLYLVSECIKTWQDNGSCYVMVILETLKLFKIFLLKRKKVNLPWMEYNYFSSCSLLSFYKYLLYEWITHFYLICTVYQALWGELFHASYT